MGRHLGTVVLFLGLAVGGGLWPSGVRAGTIRHDRSDTLYRALAGEPQYACVGKVNSSQFGSGTLVASQWVLTAKHLVGSSATFTVEGTTYAAASDGITKHPSEDVALVRLSQPASGVTPARLYEPAFGSELDREGTMVGFGRSGTGLTGDTTSSGTKRAGQNVIDWNGSVWGWSANTVLTDFDSPDGTVNQMGSPVPLDLEIGSAHGDSGGGLFVQIAGQTYLAGVQSSMWFLDGTDNADYGDGGVFTRVSQLLNWIAATIPAPGPGDANGDGRVDELDASILAAHWQQSTSAAWPDGDFNGDSRVDDLDASILAANWLSSPTAAVPEPGLAVLLSALLLTVGPGRRITW